MNSWFQETNYPPVIYVAHLEHQTPTLTPSNDTLWITKEASHSESSHSPIKPKPTFQSMGVHVCAASRYQFINFSLAS